MDRREPPLRIAESTTAGRLDDESVALAQHRHQLRRNDFDAAVGADDRRARRRAAAAAGNRAGNARAMILAAMGEKDLVRQRFVLAQHAKTARGMLADTSRVRAELVAKHAQRKLELQRLDRHVHPVGGIGVEHVDAVGRGPRAACRRRSPRP